MLKYMLALCIGAGRSEWIMGLTKASIEHGGLILRAGTAIAASIWIEEADYVEEWDY